MSRCVNCECDLPGDETLCRTCYDNRYFGIKRRRESLKARIQGFVRVAPVTSIIIAINVLVFVAMASATQSMFEPGEQQLISWGAAMVR